MISENSQRAGEYPVESLHPSEEKRSLRYPRLGSAGRNRYADAKTLFQNKPGRENALKHGAAMVDDVEAQIGEACGHLPSPKTPQNKMRSTAEHFCHHLAWTKGAKEYEHCRCARLEQACKAERRLGEVENAIQRSEIRESAIE